MPATERRGRVHTSNVTVSLLGSERRIAEAIRDEDLRVRWFSGTGAGGQHRNKHRNSVELTHVPTGIARSAQTRSRENSMASARAELEKAIAEAAAIGEASARNDLRTVQIGSGMRADKRRTWRFQDDRVIDDVTGRRASCERVMRGHPDLLWPERA